MLTNSSEIVADREIFPRKRISIYEVAQRAQCSTATVSNVLNVTGRVGPKTRRLVMRVVEELGYQISSAGRGLRTQRSERLGLLCSPQTGLFKNPFYGEVMEGVEIALTQSRYHLIFAGSRAEALGGALNGKVDGIILLGQFPNDVIETSWQCSSPWLLLDSNSVWPIDSVVSDGYNAEIQVVNCLHQKGHRNIVMLGYQINDYNMDLRIQGYLAGMVMCGLNPGVIRDWTAHDDIYAALRNRLMSPTPPTAIVTVSDSLAMAMIRRLQGDGMRVPEQVSVIGYGDDNVMLERRPFLSTVRVDKRKLGQVAAELLLKRIEIRDMPVTKLLLPTELIQRKSVSIIESG